MKILLVWPNSQTTQAIGDSSSMFTKIEAVAAPLGILTVAAMLPHRWEKRFINMKIDAITDKDIRWANYVFISAINIQRKSAKELLLKCKDLNVKTVVGGPLFTNEYENFLEADYLVLGEAEITLPQFLEDLKKKCAKHIYTANEKFANLSTTPIPLWELIDMNRYYRPTVQYSRGCPFNCEYCDISKREGRIPRTKTPGQIIAELENLYALGYRTSIGFVDDNLIGNKVKLKTELLPAMTEWMKRMDYPFEIYTQTSIDLADDTKLIKQMVAAGFECVYIGFETTSIESLKECGKYHNLNYDIVSSVKQLYVHGLRVEGGFMVGFDHDPPSVFDDIISVIQRSGLTDVTVSMVTAIHGTRLYNRLKKENRLIEDTDGAFAAGSYDINFVTKMNRQDLLNGLKRILTTIYSTKNYYARLAFIVRNYNYKPVGHPPPSKDTIVENIVSICKVIYFIGILGGERTHFWKVIFLCCLKRPHFFHILMELVIRHYHVRRHYKKLFTSYNPTTI